MPSLLTLALIYEFSHDVSFREAYISYKMLEIAPPLIKIVSALHGIPRREFKSEILPQRTKG